MEAEVYAIPLWVLVLIWMSPAIIISIIGHFIVDSLVLAGCYYLYKHRLSFTIFYKKHIFRVWLSGVLANAIGIFYFYLSKSPGAIGTLPDRWDRALDYQPFLHHLFVFVCFAMLLSAVLVFVSTYFFTFRRTIPDKKTRLMITATISSRALSRVT